MTFQTIDDALIMLKAVAPKRSRYGQLYSKSEQTTCGYSRIRVRVILRSDEGALRLHDAIFNKKAGKSPAEWSAWMKRNFKTVYVKSILPYMMSTEDRQWQIVEILGWTGDRLAKNAKRIIRNSALATRRNKTKRQGAKRGKNNLRRRHRNRKR